jgi:hypothetical protein
MLRKRAGLGTVAVTFWALMEVAALAWLVACGSTGSNGSAPPDITEPLVNGGSQAACSEMGELACITSAECTLKQAEDKSYFCAAPASACEEGFVQRSASAESCGAGCTFVPAQCYCSPDVTCICGGGPPAQCLAGS